MGIETIIDISHKYGSSAEFVLAGGGNTSYKTKDYLYIKGSGTSLSTIVENGFVKMSRKKLDEIWKKVYPKDKDEREKEVLSDMMASRCEGEENKRPSVETLLHNLFSETYVLHVHPTKVNGITCSIDGEKIVGNLFPDAIWVEETEPGYVLAKKCRKMINDYEEKTGKTAYLLFLQNHGIFFAGNTKEEIDSLVKDVMDKISSLCVIKPSLDEIEYDQKKIDELKKRIKKAYPEKDIIVSFTLNKEVENRCESIDNFAPLYHALTPDHIVYCKALPLFIDSEKVLDLLPKILKDFKKNNGFLPKIIFVKNVGMFALGKSEKDANITSLVWLDALKIHRYTENFGGLRPMAPSMVDFIVNWEVESYRSKVSQNN